MGKKLAHEIVNAQLVALRQKPGRASWWNARPGCLSLCRRPYCCVLLPVLLPVPSVLLPLVPLPPLLLDSTLVVR